MQFSTRGRYGLRAMVDLALHSSDGPMALRLIAERQGISESYLEQVFTNLRKAGLVRASRGAQGGYELSRPPKEIRVGEILRALEGPIAPVHCVGDPEVSACERERICITKPFWEDLSRIINDFLDKTNLQDLADQAPKTDDKDYMYYI